MFAKDLRPLHALHHTAAGFTQRMIYLCQFFLAGPCKEIGNGEKGCFCTRVGGEEGSFQERIFSSG